MDECTSRKGNPIKLEFLVTLNASQLERDCIHDSWRTYRPSTAGKEARIQRGRYPPLDALACSPSSVPSGLVLKSCLAICQSSHAFSGSISSYSRLLSRCSRCAIVRTWAGDESRIDSTSSRVKGDPLPRSLFSRVATKDGIWVMIVLSAISLENVKEHATLAAGASVDHGVEVKTKGEHINRAADRGCVSRLVSVSSFASIERRIPSIPKSLCLYCLDRCSRP